MAIYLMLAIWISMSPFIYLSADNRIRYVRRPEDMSGFRIKTQRLAGSPRKSKTDIFCFLPLVEI
jgi:hypothetical protein